MKRTLYSVIAGAGLSLVCTAFAATDQQAGPVLDVKQAPAPVQATLQKEGGHVTKIERETESGKTFYEATVSKNGKNHLLHMNDSGKILKREIDVPAKVN